MTCIFWNFSARQVLPTEIAVDHLQWVPAHCLYGGKNRLYMAV
jgi:hypothetical protein